MAASNPRFTQNSLGQSKNPIDSDHGIYRSSPPQLRPWARTSKEPSSARERPPPRGLFLLPTAALDGPRRYRRRPRSSPMTLLIRLVMLSAFRH